MSLEEKITLFEIPGVVLKRVSDGTVLGEVLTLYPKHPQLMVAAALRKSPVADFAKINFVDMKSEDPERLEKYGEIPFGDDVLEKLRVGASFESVRTQIKESDVIGITATFTYESKVLGDFILYVKEINSKAKVVIGGSDATARPEYYLGSGADIVMLGKAEVTGPKAIQALLNGTSLENISGIAYRDPISGLIEINPRDKKDRTDVEKLPLPALDLGLKYNWRQVAEGGLPEGVSEKVGVLETSRGCDEACSFCATTFQIGLFRSMSHEKVIENLGHIREYGTETIIFIDDNILYKVKDKYGGNRGRRELIEMFNYMRKQGFGWTFYNGIQFGLLEKNDEIDIGLIDAMFQNNNETRKSGERYVGAFRAYIPLERLTEEEAKKFKKLKPFEVQDRIIAQIAMRKPATLNMGFVIGYSHETEDDLREMEKRAFSVKRLVHDASDGRTGTYFMPFCLIPIPGTPDYRRTLKEQRFAFDINQHPELMNGYASIIRGDHFSPPEITHKRMILSERLNR